MEDFLIRAFLAGMAIAIVAGPIGCLIVWKKMAYYGDSLAHSAMLGIALGLIFDFNLNISILLIAILFAFILIVLESKTNLAMDSILGVVSHVSLALSIVLLYVLSDQNFDLHSFLFGNILIISNQDLVIILIGCLIALSVILLNWQSLIFYVINKDLAKSYGIKVNRLDLLINLLIALIVCISIQIIGVLLITSLLIIPAASARQFAKSTSLMAIGASLIGFIATLSGLTFSIFFDSPSGASIVVFLGVIFMIVILLNHLIHKIMHKMTTHKN